MATPRARRITNAVGMILLAALVAVTVWQPWLGLGVVIGLFGGAATFMIGLHLMLWADDQGHLPDVPLAVGATASSLAIIAAPALLAWLLLGPRAGIAAGATAAVVVAGFFGRVELGRQLDKRRLRGLERALSLDGDVAAALAEVPPQFRFIVAGRLADHGRWRELVAYLDGNPGAEAHARYVLDWRLAAHLALGDVDAAAAALAAAPEPEAADERALAALQALRVQIARGDAAGALAILEQPADAALATPLVSARAAIHVDALVATGDDDGARAVLAALVARYGRGYVEQLGKRGRPCSELARSVAAEAKR